MEKLIFIDFVNGEEMQEVLDFHNEVRRVVKADTLAYLLVPNDVRQVFLEGLLLERMRDMEAWVR